MADYYHTQGIDNEGTFAEENSLFADKGPRLERKVTIVAGQNLTRGAVLGRITASGKFALSTAAAGNGAEVPRAILAHDCDATAADKEAVVYERGVFDENKMVLGSGHTIASVRDGLRGLNIELKRNVRA